MKADMGMEMSKNNLHPFMDLFFRIVFRSLVMIVKTMDRTSTLPDILSMQINANDFADRLRKQGMSNRLGWLRISLSLIYLGYISFLGDRNSSTLLSGIR